RQLKGDIEDCFCGQVARSNGGQPESNKALQLTGRPLLVSRSTKPAQAAPQLNWRVRRRRRGRAAGRGGDLTERLFSRTGGGKRSWATGCVSSTRRRRR